MEIIPNVVHVRYKWVKFMSIENAKKAAGYHAAELIENGMKIGIGTGTTAHYFIKKLGERCRKGLDIQAVATSVKSERLSSIEQIPIIDINQVTALDLCVDGADEIDPLKQMIKGGGGAFVREKIIAKMSREMIIIIDETKKVEKLGKCVLPIEIIPFGCLATIEHLKNLGYFGKWRKNSDDSFFITDNHNYIFDIHFEKQRLDPERDHAQIIQLPGVVDTGFFFHLAGRVIMGLSDGKIRGF